MGAGTPVQPNFETMSGDMLAYKEAIEGSIKAAGRIAIAFAPHEQSTPDMTIRVDAGPVWVTGVLTEKAAQDSATITAPTTNPRIDRVVKESLTGVISVVTGSEAASPVAPAIPSGKEPICQIALETTTTAITNDMIIDERIQGGSNAEAFPVNAIFSGLAAADPATDLGYGTWVPLGRILDPWTSLLLHFDGSGATFQDSSLFNNIITANGNATQSATQSKFDGKSLYCNGITDYLTMNINGGVNFGTGDFTIDFWVRMDDVANPQAFISCGTYGNTGISIFGPDATGHLVVVMASNSYYFDWSPSNNTWYHIAVCRQYGYLWGFSNGTQIGAPTAAADNADPATLLFYIGYRSDNGASLRGYMDELRIRKGLAAYRANFTPPLVSYPDIYQWLRTA